MNPQIEVRLHPCRFESANAEAILREYDLIVDGTDNFATRYLSNDVAVFARKPNVYGSIFRFDGQMTVFAPHLGRPLLSLSFSRAAAARRGPELRGSRSARRAAGIVGTMQAAEALKLILGIGEPLIGRLVHFDALKMKFREFNLRRDPDCPVCGERPTIVSPIDYETFCDGAPDLTKPFHKSRCVNWRSG